MAKMIPLSQGKSSVISDIDYRRISQHKWSHSAGYAKRVEDGKTILMHREIRSTPEGMETDHRNGDGLDNRRRNIRVCTKSQNQANQKTQTSSTSGFKGVTWYKRDGKWRSQITVDNRNFFLGCFDSPEEAARAYDKEAKKQYGKFAKTNFNTP